MINTYYSRNSQNSSNFPIDPTHYTWHDIEYTPNLSLQSRFPVDPKVLLRIPLPFFDDHCHMLECSFDRFAIFRERGLLKLEDLKQEFEIREGVSDLLC